MRIQPRQQLLDIWRATARSSFQDNTWLWGGRETPNSISDAEQLLCLMVPATGLDSFKIDNPNRTDTEVLRALRPMGNERQAPSQLVRVLIEYMNRYSDESGAPIFHGGSYFGTVNPDDKPTTTQLELDVVESYAASITLSLAAISFARNHAGVITRSDLEQEVKELERLANKRLTAAMVGLLRSFTINVFEVDSPNGQELIRTVNQTGAPAGQFVGELTRQLRDVTAGLRDITLGSGQQKDLDSPGQLYECGWSWGLIREAPKIDFVDLPDVPQRDGYAEDAPYLYFTVVALDSLTDLFSASTQRQGLLDLAQQQLAGRLNYRWDMTSQYWATIARFGEGRWPLEDIPWRTTDGLESDYFSLLVSSIVVRDLAERRGTDTDLGRLGRILVELSNRSRITRRPFETDPALALHSPGVAFGLDGSEDHGPPLSIAATDFAPLLLKRAVQVAHLINDVEIRDGVLQLADDVWTHVLRRRHGDSRDADSWAGLWDQPANAFLGLAQPFNQPAWHHTIRVVESLVSAATLAGSRPLAAPDLAALAAKLLAEAEHLYDQEQIAGSTEAGSPLRAEMQSIRSGITRARQILRSRPGSANALLNDALRRLDQLTAARMDVGAQ